jgi:hypothetical protein
VSLSNGIVKTTTENKTLFVTDATRKANSLGHYRGEYLPLNMTPTGIENDALEGRAVVGEEGREGIRTNMRHMAVVSLECKTPHTYEVIY